MAGLDREGETLPEADKISSNDVTAQVSGDAPKPAKSIMSKSGWDGKLRVNKQSTLVNPEVLYDPKNADDDDVPVDQIEADEDLLEEEDPETDVIDLHHCKIRSMKALHLERFKNLRELGLRRNLISHIELPETCTSTLQELELYDNILKKIEGLEAYTELRNLDLSFNKLKSIKGLDTLTKLTKITFAQNFISKIEGLDALTELVFLELGANRIKQVEGLSRLTQLEELYLAGNTGIGSLRGGLDALANLRILDLQFTGLTSLAGIESLMQLTELHVANNRLSSLAPVQGLAQLQILGFGGNADIASLAGLAGLRKLENVWAANCGIASFKEVEDALADKELLWEVDFKGNPVQVDQPVLYLNKMRLALPQVSFIDATRVK